MVSQAIEEDRDRHATGFCIERGGGMGFRKMKPQVVIALLVATFTALIGWIWLDNLAAVEEVSPALVVAGNVAMSLLAGFGAGCLAMPYTNGGCGDPVPDGLISGVVSGEGHDLQSLTVKATSSCNTLHTSPAEDGSYQFDSSKDVIYPVEYTVVIASLNTTPTSHKCDIGSQPQHTGRDFQI